MTSLHTMLTAALVGAVALGSACRVAEDGTPEPFSVREATDATPRADTLFFEDFSGSDLDRERWNVRVTGESFGTVNNEQQAYVDSVSTLYLADGTLVLQPRYRPGFAAPDGRAYDFTSGRIDTRDKVEFTYGTAAARMKLPEGSGLWPAFWALGAGRWPDSGEIDIMEYVGEKDWTSVALHGPGYSGETPLVNKVYLPADNDATDWHVYSVDWTPEGFVFRVDGTVMYRATRPMVEHYGPWAFDNPKFLILNFALGGAYPVKTNGVDAPYPGIPASTVEAIQNDRARVLVDWVLVTQD